MEDFLKYVADDGLDGLFLAGVLIFCAWLVDVE